MRFITAILVSVFALLAGPATAERRVALVVGNSAYEHAPSLRNPSNDASALIERLRAMDFEVIDAIDADKVALAGKLKAFGRATDSADVALFFYAGHGIQVDGQNYLVPTDAQVQFEEEIPLELVSLNTVLRQMERGSKVNIVFLDACRNNPFEEALAGRATTRAAVSLGKGLGEVRAARGSYIAFATEPDKVAADGSGTNSPFTQALLAHIDTPGLSIQEMMIRVRRDVTDATNGVQTPWDSSSLMESFSFMPASAVAAATSAAPVSTSVAQSPQSAARADFDLAMSIGSCGAINAFLETHPDAGMLSALAREKAAQLCAPAVAEQTSKEEPQQFAMAMRAVRPAGVCADGPDDVKYCATSVLDPIKANRYDPSMLFDGRGDTAWVENDAADGIGETITLDFGRDRQLVGFEISNGYDKDERVWSNNSRVQTFAIALSDGRKLEGNLPDSRGVNSFDFGAPVKTRSLQLTILEIYPGAKYRDTAISELRPVFAD